MTYDQRMAAERKRISESVDSFLLALFAPGNPRKQPDLKNRANALAYYYRRKAR